MNTKRWKYDPNVSLYLRGIREYEALSPEQERELGLRIVNNKDEAACAQLVQHNLRLVVHFAKRYWRDLDFMEAIAVGNLGLCQAARLFNPHVGAFVHLAAAYINGYIMVASHAERRKREPREWQPCVSSDRFWHLYEQLMATLNSLALSDREREIFLLRHGLLGLPSPRPCQVVADEYGVTRSRIDQIENDVWDRLTRKLCSEGIIDRVPVRQRLYVGFGPQRRKRAAR